MTRLLPLLLATACYSTNAGDPDCLADQHVLVTSCVLMCAPEGYGIAKAGEDLCEDAEPCQFVQPYNGGAVIVRDWRSAPVEMGELLVIEVSCGETAWR
jgi:hypothetical protein